MEDAVEEGCWVRIEGAIEGQERWEQWQDERERDLENY